MYVLFTQDDAALASLASLQGAEWTPEVFAVGANAAWLWCADGVIESRLSKAVNKLLLQRGTARNRLTVEKLVAMARVDAG